ncbi:MAG: hypothetical protein KFW21_06010 [Spirochaetota bacterium]|nr:hypothetical protein [Spirochaetota bacterium]
MINYGDRVRKVRKAMELSQSKFGEKLDIATMIVSRIETNETSLKAPILTKIDKIGVNVSWLLTGQGHMFKSEISTKIDSIPASYSVPIVDVQASAGMGIINENELMIGTTEIGLEFKNYWGLDVVIIKINGDSMEPTIAKNSWILVKKSDCLKSEGIFIFLQDNELRCKRIQKKGSGEIIVKSDNPLYEIEIYPKGSTQLGDLILLGEVIGNIDKM